MTLQHSVTLLKAIGDSSRLMLLSCLRQGPRYNEELAEQLGLAQSTVSFHLKKLLEAGLIHAQKEQYYTMFRLDEKVFSQPLEAFISFNNPERELQADRLRAYRDKVLRVFFPKGKILQLPAQHKKRLIILEKLLEGIEFDRKYTEQEIDEYINRFYSDHCTLRRMMIDVRFLKRKNSIYWRIERESVLKLEDY